MNKVYGKRFTKLVVESSVGLGRSVFEIGDPVPNYPGHTIFSLQQVDSGVIVNAKKPEGGIYEYALFNNIPYALYDEGIDEESIG